VYISAHTTTTTTTTTMVRETARANSADTLNAPRRGNQQGNTYGDEDNTLVRFLELCSLSNPLSIISI